MPRTPLLSVVIPTHKRPQFLSRAIDSALQAAPNGDVEIIVVPNGSDTSWKAVANHYQSENRIQWHPLPTAHANVARNRGMELAIGKYLRFLDDDDYLYPEAAREQLAFTISQQLDISTGSIDLVDGSDKFISSWAPNAKETDFVSFCCSSERVQQVTGHIFLKSALHDISWDESIPFSQDICWFLDAASKKEFNWYPFLKTVGAWSHHEGDRIRNIRSTYRYKINADRLIKAGKCLERDKRLTTKRRGAIADGLWQQINNAFLYNPKYWMEVVGHAKRISPCYRSKLLRELSPKFSHSKFSCNPLLAACIIIPAKRLNLLLKAISNAKNIQKNNR